MDVTAFKWLGIAKKYYMKCQEMTWEEIKKCSSAWASAAHQGKQAPVGTSALIQMDRGPQLFLGQTDDRNRKL